MTLWDNVKLHISSNLKNKNQLYAPIADSSDLSNKKPGVAPQNFTIENGLVHVTLDNFNEYFENSSLSDSFVINNDQVNSITHYQEFLQQSGVPDPEPTPNVVIRNNDNNNKTLNSPFNAEVQAIMNLFGLQAGDPVDLHTSGESYLNTYFLSKGKDHAYLEGENASTLYGRSGDDTIIQKKGYKNNLYGDIHAEKGNDSLASYTSTGGKLDGEAGNDRLSGSYNNGVILNGGEGDDVITSSNNYKTPLLGNAGNDVISSSNDKYTLIFSGDHNNPGEDNDIINVTKTNDINYTDESIIVGGHGKTTTINVKDSFATQIFGNPSQNTFNVDNVHSNGKKEKYFDKSLFGNYREPGIFDNQISGNSEDVDTFNIKKSSGFLATGTLVSDGNWPLHDKENQVNINDSNFFSYVGGQDVDTINVENADNAAVNGREGEDLIKVNNSNNISVFGDLVKEIDSKADRKFNDVITVNNVTNAVILGGYGTDTYHINNVQGTLLDGDNAYGLPGKKDIDTVNLTPNLYTYDGHLNLSGMERVYTNNIITNKQQEVLSFKSKNGDLLVYPDIENLVFSEDRWPSGKRTYTYTYSEVFNALPPAKKMQAFE